MRKAEALRLLALLKALFPRQQLEPETVEAYSAFLVDLEADATKAAIERIACSRRWFPTVAEIREEVAAAACADLPEPEVAWGYVMRAVGRYGAHREPAFRWPELAAAVDAVGWRSICLESNIASTRARLIDAYRVCRERKVAAVQLGGYSPARHRLQEFELVVDGPGRLKGAGDE